MKNQCGKTKTDEAQIQIQIHAHWNWLQPRTRVPHTHIDTNTYTDTHRAHEAKGSNKVKVTKLAKHNRKNKQWKESTIKNAHERVKWLSEREREKREEAKKGRKCNQFNAAYFRSNKLLAVTALTVIRLLRLLEPLFFECVCDLLNSVISQRKRWTATATTTTGGKQQQQQPPSLLKRAQDKHAKQSELGQCASSCDAGRGCDGDGDCRACMRMLKMCCILNEQRRSSSSNASRGNSRSNGKLNANLG